MARSHQVLRFRRGQPVNHCLVHIFSLYKINLLTIIYSSTTLIHPCCALHASHTLLFKHTLYKLTISQSHHSVTRDRFLTNLLKALVIPDGANACCSLSSVPLSSWSNFHCLWVWVWVWLREPAESVWTSVDLRVQRSLPVAPWGLRHSSGTHLRSCGSPWNWTKNLSLIFANYLVTNKLRY